MKISLLEMGKTKKRNVREEIISILSREFPLSIKKIYNKIKKEYGLDVTYQAVFKLIKEMTDDGILEKSEMEYKLNINWIKQLEDELSIIKQKYGSKKEENNEKNMKGRIEKFVAEIGPKIKEFIGKDEACIVGVTGQGYKYSVPLWRYLLREGIKVNFVELNKYALIKNEPIRFDKKDFDNKKVIITDSEISGGTMYRLSNKAIDSVKKKFKIKEIKYAVYKDTQSIADFSIEKG